MTDTLPAPPDDPPALHARTLRMVAIRPLESVTRNGFANVPGVSIEWTRHDGLKGERELTLAEATADVERMLEVAARSKLDELLEFVIKHAEHDQTFSVELSGRFLRELAQAIEITVARMSVRGGAAASQRIDLDPDGQVRRSAAA